MRLLITGGAGFIGRNLVAHLCRAQGYEITVIDNESLGDRKYLHGFPIRFVAGDICDSDTMRSVLVDQDAVVHLAADTRVMDSIENPVHNFRTNVEGTFQLLNLAHQAGVKSIINASTGGAILGEVPPPVHEEMVAQPLSPYGASKLATEGYCQAFAGSYGMKTTSLRFSNIYGPGSLHKGSVVAAFFRRILAAEELVIYGDGSQVRDFLFTEDLTEGIVRALKSGVTGVYQLGSGRPTTLTELIELMRHAVDRPIKVRYEAARQGEIHSTWCCIEKARAAFGFDPSTPLADGLARTWSWFVDASRS